MLTLARRNLIKERVRLVISVGGVAFAVVLMVLLRGLFVSYSEKVGAYFEHIGADAWLVQRGTADFFYSFSLVPDELADSAAGVPGVAAVRPFLARQVGFGIGDDEVVLYLSGFDPDDPVTGPIELESGTTEVGGNGIVVDTVFAAEHGLEPGDRLTINDRSLRIVGISSGGDVVVFQYAFVATPLARELLGMPDVANALLVEFEPGTDEATAFAELAGLSDGVEVRSTDQVIGANERVVTSTFLPVIAVLMGIGFLVGVAVVGLTIYSGVIEKRREYGVIKAVGARSRQVVWVVILQSLLASAAGLAIGISLAFGVQFLAERLVPAFTTRIRVGDLGMIAALTAVMAAAASALPLVRLTRIDPGEVFRS